MQRSFNNALANPLLPKNQPFRRASVLSIDRGSPHDPHSPPVSAFRRIECRAAESWPSTSSSSSHPPSTSSDPSSSVPSTSSPSSEGPSVPWTLETVIKVFILWLIPSMLMGSYLMPLGMEFLAPFTDTGTAALRAQALLHLALDLAEVIITVGILWVCLRQYRPLLLGLFPFRFEGPWLWHVWCGCLYFPAIDLLAFIIERASPGDPEAWTALGSSLGAGDPVANLLYFAVVSILAPIWEEVMFRGFLLPSMTKYLNTTAAVVASSICFALAHFSVQRFLPILALGLVMGQAYVKSRNLLPPMILHALWNLSILVQLSSGCRVMI